MFICITMCLLKDKRDRGITLPPRGCSVVVAVSGMLSCSDISVKIRVQQSLVSYWVFSWVFQFVVQGASVGWPARSQAVVWWGGHVRIVAGHPSML